MINPSSREKIDFWAKEEDRQGKQDYDDQTVLFAQSRSRKWPAFRNPRIVPASRSIAGGKDRHSKVCTIRGLRDRRIRLSVATAVQIYDLQHKLGLSQPSKVVDWLLQVTKNDIDKLPPLGGFPYSPNFMNNVPLFELRQGSVREAMFSDQSSYIWEDGDYLSEVERPNNARESNVSGQAVGNFLVPTMSNFSLNNMSQFGIMSQAVHQNLFINNDTSSSVSVSGSHTQLCFSQPRPLVPPVLPPYATAATRSLVAENNLQPLLGFQLTRPPLKPVPLAGENLKVVWGENRVQSNYKVQNQGSNYIWKG